MGDIIVQKYGGSSVATTEKITNIAKRLIAVSYTHLDVYKRQTMQRMQLNIGQ